MVDTNIFFFFVCFLVLKKNIKIWWFYSFCKKIHCIDCIFLWALRLEITAWMSIKKKIVVFNIFIKTFLTTINFTYQLLFLQFVLIIFLNFLYLFGSFILSFNSLTKREIFMRVKSKIGILRQTIWFL